MLRNTMTIKKWLPAETEDQEKVFAECQAVKRATHDLLDKITVLLFEFASSNFSKIRRNTMDSETLTNNLGEILEALNVIKDKYSNIFQLLSVKATSVLEFKINKWKTVLWRIKLKLTYFIQQLVVDISHLFIFYGEKILIINFKICNIYNTLLSLDTKFHLANTMIISSNTCPYLLYPTRKISITKLLQILAQNRAELCSHKLIDCLLETYKSHEIHDDESHSDTSSVEIFRALTNHMSPTTDGKPKEKEHKTVSKVEENSNFMNLDKLIEYEEQNVLDLLNVALTIAPTMLGHDGIKKAKNGGVNKISTKAKEKVLDYYQEILWGEVGNILEHIILWWGPSPLAARLPHSSQHLREWIAQFTPLAEIPSFIIATLTSLADGLGVHVTSTSWDKNFRVALVASKCSRNEETGQLFCEMLQDLVSLCNQCEVTNEWIVGAPLDELPLVEQIPVLHRLDHSVHTTRLWAASETKKLANAWNVHAFFMITHCDIVNCLNQLNNVRMTDHSLEIEKGGLGVHVEVCSKMREKLVSEVKVNIQKLKQTTKECVQCLASVCTTISLANLKMIFPKHNYWNKSGDKSSLVYSPYVYKYLEQILTPVVKATEDYVICNMILKLMCEAWLDHIYTMKIKFSEHGALQLLTDFDGVSSWLMESPILKEVVRDELMKNEVLRRCEGVGRLLLRNPGEKIKMNDKDKKAVIEQEEGSPKSTNTELMPAEMYVPNQEQWLELRANKKKLHFVLPSLCCNDV